MKKKLSELALQFPVLEEKEMKSLNGGSDETPWDRYNKWGGVGASGGGGGGNGYNENWGNYPSNPSNPTPTPTPTPLGCPPGTYMLTFPGFMNIPSVGVCVPF